MWRDGTPRRTLSRRVRELAMRVSLTVVSAPQGGRTGDSRRSSQSSQRFWRGTPCTRRSQPRRTPAQLRGSSDASHVRLRSTRDALLTALIVLAVACSSVALLYYTARSAYIATVHEDLVQLARAAAAVVDGDLHRTFVSPEQESTPAYETAVMPLRRILHSVRGIRYLYTVVLVNQQPHFVLDATPPGDADRDGVEDHSAVLEIYEEPDIEMLVALHKRRATVMEEPEADKWGPVLSA